MICWNEVRFLFLIFTNPCPMIRHRKFPWSFPLFLVLFLGTVSAAAQQQVDMEKVLRENPTLYKGSYTRFGVGFSRSTFRYDYSFDGMILNPLHLNIDFGKRFNRKYGAYFTIAGDVLLREQSTGFDRINQWAQAGLHLGGLFYILGGNSYIAPEAGLGVHNLEYTLYQDGWTSDAYCAGIGTALRYGYDRHLTGKLYLGAQFFVSYTYTWETDAAGALEVPTASSFLYGAELNLKFGK
jgi:hypothetical protein